ncbi:hypothetical protein DM02DRAFT_343423 [Periconia macrospinosa]|uniref:Pentatricopeptide repeat domain-containing protein n=1 Tax=Periconia macrospinosa TaxID=97972 RepID=A0A2V1DXE6_9PLEO|nr:hypothetical protein DM02DRAFT_343423 [Periconia macrospinosa]
MPPALDRLLASPSALRFLRAVINTPEPPTAYLGTTSSKCCGCRSLPRRAYQIPRRKGTPLINWKKFDQQPPTLDALDVRLPNGQKPDDARTWAQCLQEKARIDRWDGIRTVWAARTGVFDLPTSDTPDAEYLWATFFKVPELVLPVILHAAEVRKKTGQLHPRLYELCMSWWLPQDRYIDLIPHYHHQLVFHLQLRKLPLRSLIRNGRQRFTSKTFSALMDIYRTSNERDVYDEIIPFLCALGNVRMVRQWHALCTRRGDHPSPHVAAEPLIQKLTASRVSHITDPEAQLVHLYAKNSVKNRGFKYNSDMLRRLQGRDTASVRFDDSLCAKLFATATFSVESVIKGLAMVGVNEIGPLGVRAMATAAVSNEEIKHAFEVLKASGIALEGKVFSLALEKFAMEGRWKLVESMLQSDQHVDVYDNMDIQKELLAYYLEREDSDQLHRTLAIMTVFHNDMTTESWNLLLRAQVTAYETNQIMHTLESMRQNEIKVQPYTMVMIKEMMRPRKRTRRPIRKTDGPPFDDLRFVTRVLFFIAQADMAIVSPLMWRELIRRYGMMGRLRELRRLLYLLHNYYRPRETGNHDIPRSRYLESALELVKKDPTRRFSPPLEKSLLSPLATLFPASLQQALIVWGFRAGLLPESPLEQNMFSGTAAKKQWRGRLMRRGVISRLDWSIGLRTVVELRDMGVKVHHHTVAKTLQAVFIILFGRGRSRIAANNRMRAHNTIWYSTYVRRVNEIWGEKLFDDPDEIKNSKRLGMSWHPWVPRNRGFEDYHLEGLLGGDAYEQDPENKSGGEESLDQWPLASGSGEKKM